MNCGCDTRREIIFTYGKPSWTEAAILAAGVAFIALAYTLNHSTGGQP